MNTYVKFRLVMGEMEWEDINILKDQEGVEKRESVMRQKNRFCGRERV